MTEFGDVLGLLDPFVRRYGVSAVFLILTLESLGIPLPGETLLIAAAILAERGDISLPSLFLAAWSGAIIGDNIGYLIGRSLGHALLLRHGRKVWLDATRLAKVERVFARYGPATVGFARFVNVLRQLNGLIAGALEMNWWKFLFFNALGGAAWVLTWIVAGSYLGTHGADIAALARKLGYVGTGALIIAAFAGLLTYAHVRRRS